MYPSKSPINKKSQLNIRLNVDEEQENNGNDLYLNINNQSTLSLKTISNNDTEIFKNNSQFNDNFVNSEEFNDEGKIVAFLFNQWCKAFFFIKYVLHLFVFDHSLLEYGMNSLKLISDLRN